MTMAPAEYEKWIEKTNNPLESEKLTYPVYVICGPFTQFKESLKFKDYKAAAMEAQNISKYAKEYKIEVRLFEHEDQDIGLLVSSFEQGDPDKGIQVNFLKNESVPAKKTLRELGKAWLETLRKYSEKIWNLRSKMTLSDEERAELHVIERLQDDFLESLKQNMKFDVYLTAKWKYVDKVEYGNREVAKPAEIAFYHDSTRNRKLYEAYDIVAQMALRENWKLSSSARATFDQFLARTAVVESEKQVPEMKPRRKRKPNKKHANVSQDETVPLFDYAMTQEAAN